MMNERAAEDIAEDLLYRTGQALVTGDFSWLDGCFDLPQYMETLDGQAFIQTEEALHGVFRHVREYFTEQGVTDVVRTVIKAEFLAPNTIESTHASRLLRPQGEVFRAPYPVYSIIRKSEQDWKIVSSAYAILDDPEHNRALMTGVPDT